MTPEELYVNTIVILAMFMLAVAGFEIEGVLGLLEVVIMGSVGLIVIKLINRL